jgi:eukaryotic-like serine/threonine-protein kinase
MAASQPLSSDPHGLVEDPFAGTEYRAMSLLGSGGMGDVYVVKHRTLEKIHAAKLLRAIHARDRRVVDRMRLEAHALAKLRHANVVQIHDFSVTPTGLPFIVMELLNGRTLKDELVAKGSMPLHLALVFTVDLLSGLEAVHGLGIVHRDIKPSNLFIHANDAGALSMKMLDFGVARVIPGINEDAPEPLLHPTRTGTVVGTPIFVSPEAALGRPVDVRTDIYNAAIMLYVMLTGRGPFDDLPDNEAIIHAHAHLPAPPPARNMKHWLGPLIDEVVLRGLAKEPKDRYQTAAEFSQAVYGLIQECLKTGKGSAANGKQSMPPEVSPTTTERRSSASIQESRSSPALERSASARRPANVRLVAFLLVVILTAIAVRLAVRWSLG